MYLYSVWLKLICFVLKLMGRKGNYNAAIDDINSDVPVQRSKAGETRAEVLGTFAAWI